MATPKTIKMVALQGENYPTWRLQSKMALMRDGLWEIVTGTEEVPAAREAAAKYQVRKNKALANLVLSIDPELLYLLGDRDPTEPKDVWDAMGEQFQRKSWARQLDLKRKLFALKLSKGESMQKHVKMMSELLDEISRVSEPVKKEERVMCLLASLPIEYKTLVTALQASEEVPKMSVVIERLLQEEKGVLDQEKEVEKAGEIDALMLRERRRIKCYQCGKLGHIRRECRERSPNDYGRENYGGLVRDDKEETISLMVAQAHATQERSNGMWIIDSGASSHICNDVHMFDKLHGCGKGTGVTVANGKVLKATGRGTVKVDMVLPRGKVQCTLNQVLLVPGLKYNLFSVSSGMKEGGRTQFSERKCQVEKGGQVVAMGHREGGIYYLQCRRPVEAVHISKECGTQEESESEGEDSDESGGEDRPKETTQEEINREKAAGLRQRIRDQVKERWKDIVAGRS